MTSPTPRSPGWRRSCHGTHSGGTSASGPGSSTVSHTVTCLERGTRATVTAQRQPWYPGVRHSNRWVTTRSPSGTASRCLPGSSSVTAARARSTASAHAWSSLLRVATTTRSHSPLSGRRWHRGDAIRQDGGMPSLGKTVGYTVKGVRLTARGGRRATRWVSRKVMLARHRGGAGEAGMTRLLDLHAISCAGDALVTMGLAGTVFFGVAADAARTRVALYLLITMAPFALIAPVIGPVLDRYRHGRRTALAVTMFGRAFLAWMIADYIHGLGLYPAAFGVLVLSRACGVARSAAVPRLLPATLRLSEAGARASVFGTVAGAVVVPIGAVAFTLGAQWPLRVAALIFLAGSVVALRLPPRADSEPPETVPAIFNRRGKALSGRLVFATLTGAAWLRALFGFLALFLAFAIRAGHLDTRAFHVTFGQPGALGVIAAALGVGAFLATAVGTRLHIDRKSTRLNSS